MSGGGKGGGPSGSSTTVQVSDPWSGQQPYLLDAFGQAKAQYQSGAGSFVAPFGPDSLAAQSMTRQLAMNPDQASQEALARNRSLVRGEAADPYSRQLQAETSGAYLNANPYLDATFNQAAEGVRQQYGSAFGLGGRFGSPAHQESLAKGLAGMATQIYGGNYAQERDRQQLAARTGLSGLNQAIGRAPDLDQAQYVRAQLLGGVGAQQESLQQATANAPAEALARYAALIQGGYGGTSTTRTPLYTNPAANILGGAATGAGIGGMISKNGGGYGAAAGGLLGLLSSF